MVCRRQIVIWTNASPFYWQRLTLILARIGNHMPSKVGWNYLSILNFNGCTVEVWEWISYFIPHILMDVITYPWWYCIVTWWPMCGHITQHVVNGTAVEMIICVLKSGLSVVRGLGPWLLKNPIGALAKFYPMSQWTPNIGKYLMYFYWANL